MAFMTPIQILLPLQLEHIDPHGKNDALSLVTGLGALVAVLADPLAGAWSDRTTSRFGHRRPWILGGAPGPFVWIRPGSSAGAWRRRV